MDLPINSMVDLSIVFVCLPEGFMVIECYLFDGLEPWNLMFPNSWDDDPI